MDCGSQRPGKARQVYSLVISKLPEFTPEGEVIPGQCEPYTDGWRLRLIEDGSEESILTGTYYELRRVQKRCIGRSADDARKLVAEAAEAMKDPSSADGSAKKDASESTQILGMDEVRRAMLEMELTAALDDFDGEAEWLSVSQQNGVAIASVDAGVESVGAYEAAGALGKAFEAGEAAFVIDLGGRAPAGAGFAEHLGRLAARAKEEGRFLGLVGGSEDLAGQLGGSSEDAPKLFDDLESALTAAAGEHETEGAAGAPSGSPGRESSEE